MAVGVPVWHHADTEREARNDLQDRERDDVDSAARNGLTAVSGLGVRSGRSPLRVRVSPPRLVPNIWPRRLEDGSAGRRSVRRVAARRADDHARTADAGVRRSGRAGVADVRDDAGRGRCRRRRPRARAPRRDRDRRKSPALGALARRRLPESQGRPRRVPPGERAERRAERLHHEAEGPAQMAPAAGDRRGKARPARGGRGPRWSCRPVPSTPWSSTPR